MTIKVTLKLMPWSDWTADAMPRVDQTLVYAGTFVPDLARWAAYVLRISALGCFALAAWRFGYDVKAAQPFFITEGVLSHWQTYVALTGATVMLAAVCGRLAPEGARRRIALPEDDAAAPVVWHARQFPQPLEQAE
jgi:hypothetical protein